MSDLYSSDELRALGPSPIYSGAALKEIAFPIGGIGTGSVSLTGIGALADWEIFNRPNKGSLLPNTFFALWARPEGDRSVTKVLQAPPLPPYTGIRRGQYRGVGFGVARETGAGLPHLRDATFRGEYPFAWIDFQDREMPVEASLEAYNPFIPLNTDDSSLPAAIFRVTLRNPGDQPAAIALATNLYNAVGHDPSDSFFQHGVGGNVNTVVDESGLHGILMTNPSLEDDDPRYGSMMLATPWSDVDIQACWLRGAWFDELHAFWDEFSTSGTLSPRNYGPSETGRGDTGSIVLRATLIPGESVTLPFFIVWHFPNFVKYWNPSGDEACDCEGHCQTATWKNYYATRYADALAVACYLAAEEPRLRTESLRFHDALFASTLPPYVLDAVSSQMSTLKTTTVLRLEDGTFYGFEGCHADSGCCEGSCNHVWNYAQTHAFLFPTLQRSMRAADYKYNLHANGKISFRLQLPLGSEPWEYYPAADGQMGGIMQVYRDWRLSGDDEWLRALWPLVKKALAYAWIPSPESGWDVDRDGVMEGIQHNTYDIEFVGPNPMMTSLYLGALRAAEEMARAMGEPEQAEEYRSLFESGCEKMDCELFNGEFYIQKHDPAGAPKYQFGAGCLSDQLIGQWLARLSGLGDLLDPDHVRTALTSIFRYNWRTDFWDHANPQRIYALNDERGLLLCTWPHGGRPALPFVYSDEVWAGIEYQVASHLIYEGLVEEGLTIVKGVRERHDGIRRNPWNEFECGSHYARSMASWAVLTALSGFSFDLPHGHLGFAPCLYQGDFRVFWSCGTGWGTYHQTADAVTLSVAYGRLRLKTLSAPPFATATRVSATAAGQPVPVTIGDSSVAFEPELVLQAGQSLEVLVRMQA
ncbi:MAG TPA: hypothetical protein EYP04_09015 [Anaerolineae bacterium]|nr:hypothetical protein [Anaerolineae bacterium]HIQ06446.1 hypothetical protein [Anaerolineae bacterium]